jgi:hypothetical protein
MADWLHFSDPRFGLRFRYPTLATDGEPVERLEMQREDAVRVHILAPKCREVYFEVSRYELLTAVSEYQRHKDHLATRFDSLVMSNLHKTVCAGLPAHTYTFEWDQGRRVILLVERSDGTYRIIYNPHFPINVRILSTLEWITVP